MARTFSLVTSQPGWIVCGHPPSCSDSWNEPRVAVGPTLTAEPRANFSLEWKVYGRCRSPCSAVVTGDTALTREQLDGTPLKQNPFNSSQTVRDPCGVSSWTRCFPSQLPAYFRPSSMQTTATGESHFYLHLERATNMTQERTIPRFHTHTLSPSPARRPCWTCASPQRPCERAVALL